MMHDPLCDWWQNQCASECNTNLAYGDPCEHMWCTCELIAKVRADCLEKVEGAYVVGSDGKALTPSHPEYSHDGTETWNAAVSTAVAYMTGKID